MNKTELIEKIAAKSGLMQKNASACLNSLIEITEEELQRGCGVLIPGFGSFSVAERAARTATNFKTKEKMTVPASKYVKFKVGKTLKESVK